MNKKVVGIFAFIIFAVAIFVISLFGKIPYKPPTQVYCSSVTFDHVKDANGSVKIELTKEVRTFQLKWIVGPEDADNKNVVFFFDESKVTVSETGLVTFKEGVWGASITVKTVDKSDKTDSIVLYSDIPGDDTEIDP